ncbi:MAG TPA: hypothetical protein VN223_05335 [Candidatus Elarobacter sp.]|nr:hypothetical protein [Candidatus Elarobacter sp.]
MTTPAADAGVTTAKEETRTKEQVEKEDERRAFISALSEMLFVLLPFIVIAITLAYRREFRTILFLPEWSIVSAVIVGQSIVKLASAGIGRSNVQKEMIVLYISSLLVCLLVPILCILAITLTSPSVTRSVAVTQAVFFSLSVVVFVLACWIDNLDLDGD